jgi:hypothetical protein
MRATIAATGQRRARLPCAARCAQPAEDLVWPYSIWHCSILHVARRRSAPRSDGSKGEALARRRLEVARRDRDRRAARGCLGGTAPSPTGRGAECFTSRRCATRRRPRAPRDPRPRGTEPAREVGPRHPRLGRERGEERLRASSRASPLAAHASASALMDLGGRGRCERSTALRASDRTYQAGASQRRSCGGSGQRRPSRSAHTRARRDSESCAVTSA